MPLPKPRKLLQTVSETNSQGSAAAKYGNAYSGFDITCPDCYTLFLDSLALDINPRSNFAKPLLLRPLIPTP